MEEEEKRIKTILAFSDIILATRFLLDMKSKGMIVNPADPRQNLSKSICKFANEYVKFMKKNKPLINKIMSESKTYMDIDYKGIS